MIAVLLGVQGLIFAVWTFLAFRTLFRLRARAVAASGQMFPGLGATLAAFAGFWRDPVHAPDRRAMGWASLAMVVVMAANAWVLPGLAS